MTSHTEGKWVVREQETSFTIGQEFFGGKLIAETAPFFSYLGVAAKEVAQANARRIAACVNELDGLTTDQIEEGVFQKMREHRDFLAAEVGALTKQRDELLYALESLLGSSVMSVSHGEYVAVFDEANSVLAKAKGGAV